MSNEIEATLELRPAVPTESEFAFRVWKATMEQYIDATWGWDEDAQRQRQQEEFAALGTQIIEVKGQPVGTCIIKRQPDCFYLSGLYILPEYQGRGLGSQVLKLLLSESHAQKMPVRLRVLRVNPAARRLYERYGFIVTDETETLFVIMEKMP